VHTPEIANSYDAFLSGTPLTTLDLQFLEDWLPRPTAAQQIVADLGCGTGRILSFVTSRGYQYLGLDLSQTMLLRLGERAVQEGLPCWRVRVNLVSLQALAPQSLDHAVCLFSTLGMVRGRENRRLVLSNLKCALKPQGRLILHAHNVWASLRDPGGARFLMTSWWQSRGQQEADFGDRTYGYRGLGNMFLHSYSRRELLSDLRATGFNCRAIEPVTIRGNERLSFASLFPSLRAGGFMILAERRQ
jgi:SAM-dependent methyltransferase